MLLYILWTENVYILLLFLLSFSLFSLSDSRAYDERTHKEKEMASLSRFVLARSPDSLLDILFFSSLSFVNE
jgi:hypothetical protein